MKGHPISFRDGAYDAIESGVEAKLGLPRGLLAGIRTKGERTNADRVSNAGARTVYQVIPSTRKAAIKKYGIDPYLSAENAAEVAGRLLKDSLDRNRGDVIAAVREYHGGTDRKNWGPVNRAYVQRVTGGAAPADARPQSTFDRVRGQRQEQTGPTIASVYEAYKAGKLPPEAAAEFEADVESGAVLLPRGATLKAKPAAAKGAMVLPPEVVAAYNNHSEYTDADRRQIDKDVADGVVALPQGATLKRPDPRTAGEYLGMGGRDILTGAAGLVDLPLDALKGGANIAYDATIGPITDLLGGKREPDLALGTTRAGANMLADALGLAKPATPGEQMVSAINEGITGGVATAGLGSAASGLSGVAGGAARSLAAAPVVDVVGGATGAASAEGARQAGAGPLVQVAAGLAGGGLGAGAAAGAKRLPRIAERFGPKTAKVVETVPREVVMDEAGVLTEEGREVALRAEVQADDLRAAYDEQEAPEAAPVARQAEVGVAVAEAPVEAPQKLQWTPEEVAALRKAGVEIGEDGRAVRKPPPEAAPTPTDPPTGPAAARVAEAASENIPLTKGQATQDFATQDAEQTLLSGEGSAPEQARGFRVTQQERIQAAVDRTKARYGDTAAGPEERADVVRSAISALRDEGKAGVTAAYKAARDLAAELGDDASELIALDPAPIRQGVRDLLIDETVPQDVRNGLRQWAAKFGLIGESPKTVEGTTTVMLRDNEGNLVKGPSFPGQVEPLTLVNAERFRAKINDMFDPMRNRNPQEAIKPLLDDAIEAASARAAAAGKGDVGKAFGQARELYKADKRTFESKDVIEQLIASKKGTLTEVIPAHRLIDRIFGTSPNALRDLKKVKAILLNKATPANRAAWKAIQAHGIAKIFDQAFTINTNAGGGQLGSISGAKLNTAAAKFGADKLKVLLDPADFNHLKKLQRIIGNATIPISGTTNPSGTASKVISFLSQQGQRLAPVANMVPGVRFVVDGAGAMLKAGKSAAESKATLEGVTNFTPKAAEKVDAKSAARAAKAPADPATFVRQFLDLAGSERLIQPLLQGAAQAGDEQ